MSTTSPSTSSKKAAVGGVGYSHESLKRLATDQNTGLIVLRAEGEQGHRRRFLNHDFRRFLSTHPVYLSCFAFRDLRGASITESHDSVPFPGTTNMNPFLFCIIQTIQDFAKEREKVIILYPGGNKPGCDQFLQISFSGVPDIASIHHSIQPVQEPLFKLFKAAKKNTIRHHKTAGGDFRDPNGLVPSGYFVMENMTPQQKKCFETATTTGGRFGVIPLLLREKLFGHKCLSQTREMSLEYELKHKAEAAAAARKKSFASEKKKYLTEYNKLKQLERALAGDAGIRSLRSGWENIFTARCDSPSPIAEGGLPCINCRGCRRLFAQVTLVIVSAQGVSDSNILSHWGAVFKHHRYINLSVDQWADLPPEEFCSLFGRLSKLTVNFGYCYHYFQYLKGKPLPREIHEITCAYGFKKKSASLILNLVLGFPIGVPIDRHLAEGAVDLGWCAVNQNKTELISAMVETWLPQEEWGEVNNVLAGLRQLLVIKSNAEHVRQKAIDLGCLHLLQKLAKSLKGSYL